ncbi:MAG: 30S ribosomal protein S8 [Dethiobacteria bacterium]|jgi:small subunit ribosomal protein S8|nr:30S ribosomal protein S8 [Bacillota bacterium]NMD34068.1 30S ribosomal protein S8 [Bacillota bacterium]HOB29110.1 30S ribosomal protein S8 [Bacillota bacterium]HPZ41682.1 30S ribosomal protein S8 [Bacillota bacterium]HQD52264.1 30S ribosomal protein S8 [Bacillota bacterium]
MMTDPIADMLTRVRNANMVRHTSVDIPASKLKRSMAQIMKEEGFIKDFEFIENKKQGIVRIYLKYGPDSRRAITGLKRISKPGLRVYANKDELPKVLGGLGVAIISTSRGVMSDREARKIGCGGEVICYIW